MNQEENKREILGENQEENQEKTQEEEKDENQEEDFKAKLFQIWDKTKRKITEKMGTKEEKEERNQQERTVCNPELIEQGNQEENK